MDNSIRRNERCVISLPKCDYVFSSTRSCFIGYGFRESPLEVGILRRLLEERGIDAVEASGSLTLGQYAFCTKICSKIIVSQFSIVLINDDTLEGVKVPNANVHMEYGLMLGFNKYVIPFQRESDKLAFNISGLDTVKYSNVDFEVKEKHAIEQAIKATNQDNATTRQDVNQNVLAFLLSKNVMLCTLQDVGEQNIFHLGNAVCFNLLTDFEGFQYVYFGNFAHLTASAIAWRLDRLQHVLRSRLGAEGLAKRVALGLINPAQSALAQMLLSGLRIWILTANDGIKANIAVRAVDSGMHIDVFSLEDVESFSRSQDN